MLRRARRLVVVLATLAGPLVAACGGPSARPVPAPASSADGGILQDASAPTAALGPLPPMAKMPAPGVVGSRKVELREPKATLKPSGTPLHGTQADRDPHQEHTVRVAAGGCVRVALVDPKVAKDLVLVARDDAGDVIAESSTGTVPERGAMCVREASTITVLVGVGTGKASYALQVWSD